MRLLLATNNKHKLLELQEILDSFELITPADVGIELDVDETGSTFLENALLKANALHSALVRMHPDRVGSTTIIADDSGLCVDSLEGGPGIYSARFGSPDGGKTELDAGVRNQLLLESLSGETSRGASFVCCMVALLPAGRMIVAQESWHGSIAHSPSEARGGFGYDPIFVVPGRGCTAADLPASEKNRISHRGRAAAVLAAALRTACSLA